MLVVGKGVSRRNFSQGGKISPECGQYLPKGWDEREQRSYLRFSIIFFCFLFTIT